MGVMEVPMLDVPEGTGLPTVPDGETGGRESVVPAMRLYTGDPKVTL